MESGKPDWAAAISLLSAGAVRERAHAMLALGLDDKLPNFRVDLGKIETTAGLVLATTRKAYPALDIPFHARWRHFVVQGRDRWAEIAGAATWRDRAARARAEFDLAIVSVLLDAGAGTRWRYRDPATGVSIGRSEGLALASLAMFAAGAFSSNPGDPLRVDAEALKNMRVEQLSEGFQCAEDNPLPGLEGRVDLLRRLAENVAGNPVSFADADTPRPGGLFDRLSHKAAGTSIPAPEILKDILLLLDPI